jgi:AcrR family transcriptional regulator
VPDRGSKGEDEQPEVIRPLHGGRHSLSPDLVAFNQRERLLGALAQVVAERGYNKATIAQITDTAQVSRRTFYENFESKQDCFFAAYDALDAYLDSLVAEATAGQAEWPDQVAAAFATLLRFLATRPELARLYLLEAAAVGEGMASRRAQTAARFIALLEPGRRYRDGEAELVDGIEEAVVGGIVTLLARRIAGGEAAQLDRFIPAVIEFALGPYLGSEEARRVIARHG